MNYAQLYYLSVPGLTLNAMLKMTKIELELIPDRILWERYRELPELHNGYPLARDKIEIKREMSSEYQLVIADLYNIPVGNVKKLVPEFFDKEKNVLNYENLQLYLRLELKLKRYIVY